MLVKVEKNLETYIIPKLRRTIKPILTRIFKLRFQKMSVGKTAKNKSQAEFAPGVKLGCTYLDKGGKRLTIGVIGKLDDGDGITAAGVCDSPVP